MNKKSICVAIASLLCLGSITACSEIEAKANGKKKRDYDITNNVEIAGYLDQEITYNGIHFNLEERDEKNYWRLKISSTNEDIESYDVIEAYTCNLNGKLSCDFIISPTTFKLKNDKVAYYDLGYIYITEFYRGYDSEDDYSFVDELRIIGESANITFHMWHNDALISNGKTVKDYDCSKNIVKDAHVRERLKFKVEDDEIIFNAFPVNKAFLNDTLCIQGALWNKYSVDIVEVYATDANDENRVDLLDKPTTMDFEKNYIFATSCIDNVSKEYYKQCDGNIRYHIVTNYFTAIFQTYDYFVNGKTADDYDLSSLEQYDGDCTSYYWYKERRMSYCILGDPRNSSDYPWLGGYIDEKNNLIGFKILKAEKANVESIDIIKTYFSDENGDNVREYSSTPITLHKYIDESWGDEACYFRVPIDDSFKEYYALCKNNPCFTLVTTLGIMKMELVDYQIKGSLSQPGKFIDVSADEYANYTNMEPVTDFYGSAKFENKHIITIEQDGIFGLPYTYSLTFKNHDPYLNESLTIFEAYFTDADGHNKVQVFDKAYKRTFDKSSDHIVEFLAPEYSYYLNAGNKIVLHLVTSWGTANFNLE